MDVENQNDEVLPESNTQTDAPSAEPTKSLREEIQDAREEVAAREPDAAKPPGQKGKLSLPNKPGAKPGAAGSAQPNAAGATGATNAQSGPVTAPKAWKSDMRSKFDTLPEDVKKYVNEREEEIQRGVTKWDEDRNFGKNMRDLINPYMPIIKAEGGNALTAAQDLFNTAYILRTASPAQKSQLILKVCQQYGVNPASLVTSSPKLSPGEAALHNRIAQLEGVISKGQMAERQAKDFTEQQERGEADRIVTDFKTDPANVHLDTVSPMMQALLRSGQATDLKDAYDKACWANPEIRAIIQQNQSAPNAENARISARNANADRARRAGSSVTGSPGLAVPSAAAVPDRTLADELRHNLRAATAG